MAQMSKARNMNSAITTMAPTGVDDERLAQIKLEILNGTYLTDERIEAACEAMFNDVTQTRLARSDSSQQLAGC